MDITLIAAFIAAMGIPSAITGFCFWLLQRKIQKRDDEEKKEREARQKKMDQRESAREKNEIYMIKSIGAAIALAEATAKAVQRIPDAKCNGDIPDGTEVHCYGYYTKSSGTKWYYIQFTMDGVQYTGFSSSKYLLRV